ncbi:YfcE family phosphodiesterase [Fulvivirgaceae bacterium PWU4]|uniref:Phosphoesterase n=1 Tax=Chryseosolibacter histidini TaxID=2782349 RepID=A0AAP2GR86_9BACT|nr:metallophosphoesterase family protein [Chryseosolibacter histidini]MBT1700913.1 YfcE family phosphodiesterase [Chryseosolibacter histidini]
MKIGFISDIHGNHIALKEALTFLRQASKVSEIFFLGDAIGYMPDANAVVTTLREENINCLMGNHEAMFLGWLPTDARAAQVYQFDKIRGTMADGNLEFLKKQLPFREISVSGTRILMVHGSPVDPLNGYLYPDTPLGNMQAYPYDFVLMGHTHRPFIRQHHSSWYVNVGSCGMPRDTGALAAVAVLDVNTKEARIYRLPLNIAAMREKYKGVHPDVENLWERTIPVKDIVGEII